MSDDIRTRTRGGRKDLAALPAYPSREVVGQVIERHGKSHGWDIEKDLEDTFPEEVREAAIRSSADEIDQERGVNSPGARVRQARILHSNEYSQEYAMRLLHRLLLRNVPADQIARTFNVSVPTIYRWRNKLKDALAREAARIEVNPLIGDSMGFYSEIRGTALQETAKAGLSTAERMRCLEIAMKAERDRHSMLAVWGVPLARRFTPEEADYSPVQDAQEVLAAAEALVQGNISEVLAEAENEDVELDLHLIR